MGPAHWFPLNNCPKLYLWPLTKAQGGLLLTFHLARVPEKTEPGIKVGCGTFHLGFLNRARNYFPQVGERAFGTKGGFPTGAFFLFSTKTERESPWNQPAFLFPFPFLFGIPWKREFLKVKQTRGEGLLWPKLGGPGKKNLGWPGNGHFNGGPVNKGPAKIPKKYPKRPFSS